MITLLFVALMLGVFGKLIAIAVKMTWGITKVVLGIIVLPLVLIAMAVAGLFYIAIPILIILGIVMLIKAAATN